MSFPIDCHHVMRDSYALRYLLRHGRWVRGTVSPAGLVTSILTVVRLRANAGQPKRSTLGLLPDGPAANDYGQLRV